MRIPDDDVKNLSTVGDAVSYIAKAQRLTRTRSVPDLAPGTDHPYSTRDCSTDDRRTRVVVTGLGATTPARWRRPDDLGRPCWPAGPGSGPDRGLGRHAAGAHSRHRWRSTRPRCCRGRDQADRPRPASSRSSRPARPGPTPARPRSTASGSASSSRSGIGGVLDPARQVRPAQGEAAPRRVLPLDGADAHAQRPGGARRRSSSAPAPACTRR